MKSWAQEDIPKLLEMKLSCKYQLGSFFDHQDGWRIVNKQRRTTLCHATRQSRRNLSCISNEPQFVNQESTKIKKGLFVTNHFNKKKGNTISNQALCNIKSHSQENSIIQTWFCILQNSSMGDRVLQNISCERIKMSKREVNWATGRFIL